MILSIRRNLKNFGKRHDKIVRKKELSATFEIHFKVMKITLNGKSSLEEFAFKMPSTRN